MPDFVWNFKTLISALIVKLKIEYFSYLYLEQFESSLYMNLKKSIGARKKNQNCKKTVI